MNTEESKKVEKEVSITRRAAIKAEWAVPIILQRFSIIICSTNWELKMVQIISVGKPHPLGNLSQDGVCLKIHTLGLIMFLVCPYPILHPIKQSGVFLESK